jgi:hypothetical protein
MNKNNLIVVIVGFAVSSVSFAAEVKYNPWRFGAWIINLNVPLLSNSNLNNGRAPARPSTPAQLADRVERRRSSRADVCSNNSGSLSPQEISKLEG